ncbi:MAG: type IV secretion system protein [Rickettsiales bacterium]|jgi:type IV secretion system protein VirB8
MSKQPNNIKESRNWYKDRYQSIMLQRRLLMFLTIMSMLSTLVGMIIIAQISPLKGVEPFLIQVDAKSGITQVVDPTTVREITALESVNNYFVVQYIRARESYNVRDITQNYTKVRVMSDPAKVYQQFKFEAAPGNPNSVIARVGGAGTRRVKFKSISYIKPNQAQVRLLIEETAANGGTLQSHKIATVIFEYAKLDLNSEERYINPLGFRVTEYRVDEDTMPR